MSLEDDLDPTDIAGQEQQAEAKAEAARLARDLEVNDLKWLLSDVRGRRFFWRLLTQTHVFHTSSRPNALEMARLEGERNIGLKHWGDLHEHAPDAYPQMVKEQQAHGNRNSGDRAKRHKR